MNKVYTGIGSRETPEDVLRLMTYLADLLARRGQWVVRTGGTPGADTAFYAGAIVHDASHVEIYLPWEGFNDFGKGVEGSLQGVARHQPQAEAFEIAAAHHPAWHHCKFGARKLHARNVHQVLGYDVTNPTLTSFVVCWTKGGKLKGGTAEALRLAQHYEVPIYNLGNPLTLALFSDILGA